MARPGMTTRRWLWLQLFLGWLPVWALYTLLLSPVNPLHRNSPAAYAVHGGLIAISLAALLGFVVQRLTERIPWPHPFRARFLLLHLGAAALFSVTWLGLKTGLEYLLHHASALAFHHLLIPNLVLGVWLYVMVAGVSYATAATARAAQAEASAARSQLAALRGQLNPHFLFNALHTVVQLIPIDPKGAARAAELVAGLLRTTLEEDRDLVTLAEEQRFVERYLEIERIRFGERLRDRIQLGEETRNALLPSFALQTLVENAVRHGAAPRVEPTDILIDARMLGAALHLTVRDTGMGIENGRGDRFGASGPAMSGTGTGLDRLRERLAVLYGREARLELQSPPDGGCLVTLVIPQREGDGDAP